MSAMPQFEGKLLCQDCEYSSWRSYKDKVCLRVGAVGAMAGTPSLLGRCCHAMSHSHIDSVCLCPMRVLGASTS